MESSEENPKSKCKQELMAIHDSLDILGGKWKLQILNYLSNRTDSENNFTKIKNEIGGISAKMLSKELRILEENLLVRRMPDQNGQSAVTYAITSYGKSVLPVSDTLLNWGLKHRRIIKETLR